MTYSPKCDPPAEVYVDGTRIPVFELKTHIRKGGVLDINFLSEVHYPSEWQGVDYNEIVKPLNEDDRSPYSSAEIKVRDAVTNELETIHAGFVNGVGQSANGQLPRQMKIVGLESFLTAIPASQNFWEGVSVADVLEYIVETFQSAQPIVDTLHIKSETADIDEIYLGEGAGIWTNLKGSASNIGKSFAANRNTLSDVVDWLTEITGAKIWFEYSDDMNLFSLRYEDAINYTSHQAKHLGGNVIVKKNRAINQISPYNTVEVQGRSKESLFSVGGHSLLLPADQYPYAEVQHPQLVDLAGGKTLKPPIEDVSATTLDGAEQQAKSILKQIITKSNEGQIITRLAPSIQPYDALESRPSCHPNAPATMYEAEEIIHIANSSQTQTELFTSLKIDPNDIEVAEKRMKDV